MKVVCVSDTHGLEPKLPDGDLLIHAGDLAMQGKDWEIDGQVRYLARQMHQYKLVIGGNHDFALMEHSSLWADRMLDAGIRYLRDSWAVVDGLSVYGSPWSLPFYDWAFQMDECGLERLYSTVEAMDILITHGPPKGILDFVGRQNVGSEAALRLAKRTKPKLHVFGHIHESYGVAEQEGTIFVNASHCGMFGISDSGRGGDMRRVLIFGSREYKDFLDVVRCIANLHDTDTVISGGAHGPDAWALNLAHFVCRCPNPCRHMPPPHRNASQTYLGNWDGGSIQNLNTEVYFADWGRYGNAAGPIRNSAMARAQPDFGIGFWDGVSRGSKDMARKLRRAGKVVLGMEGA